MSKGNASFPAIAFLPIEGEDPGNGKKQGVVAYHILFLGPIVGTKHFLFGSEATDKSTNQSAIIYNRKGAKEW